MSIDRLSYDTGVLLGALRVPYKITNIIKNVTTQFIIQDFGVIVSVFSPENYTTVDERLDSTFKGWRKVFVTNSEDLNVKRYEIIWALMKSGYMKWLRFQYSAQFSNILETDGLGNRIIKERIDRWNDLPKYKFLIQDNIIEKNMPIRQLLSKDPSFFDYMP
jgi:hypothetical protein